MLHDLQLINGWQDGITGSLEFVGGAFLWLNVRAALTHRMLRGLQIQSSIFFWLWSMWNLYWYPHVAAPFSMLGAVSLLVPQTIWLFLIWKYRRH